MKIKQRADKKKAKEIAEWAERKQRAHNQMIITRMMCKDNELINRCNICRDYQVIKTKKRTI